MAYSHFDDVWNRLEDAPVCGYCAAEVEDQQTRCPRCRRRLYTTVFRYPGPSSNFYIFLLLLIALVQLSLIQVIVDFLSEQEMGTIIRHAFFIPIFSVLAFFVYRRSYAAYVGALLTLLLAASQLTLTRFTPADWALPLVGTPLSGLYDGFSLAISQGVFWLQAAAIGLAFFIGLLWTSPDFTKDRLWLWARLPRDLSRRGASSAHMAAERYARQELWALAAVHWQRAVVADPGRLLYYLCLIDAYRRLGFKERALDMIHSAEQHAQTPAGRAKLHELRVQVKQLTGE